MTSFPWLTVIGALPLAGAVVIAAIPAASQDDTAARAARDLLVKQVALVFSLLTLGLTVAMAVRFSPGGPTFQFTQTYQWIPQFGVHYAVGVDGIALVLIGMTAVLMPVVILASWRDADPVGAAGPVGPGGTAGPEGPGGAETVGAGGTTGPVETAGAGGPAGQGETGPAGAGGAGGTAGGGETGPPGTVGTGGTAGPVGTAGAGGAAVAAPPRRSVKTYFALMLLLETLVIGVFAATDVFLFYVFFEAMLIPMYFMIGSYGVGQRQYAAVKFLLYSLLGGLLMLVAVIALFVYSSRGGHPGTFLFGPLTHLALSPVTERWLFLGFFIGFAIKAPLWPFHTWLPDAATSAQPGAAVLLVGVLDKVGTFGMIRYCLQLFPHASRYFIPLIITLAVIGILYGAIVAIGQADIKRLIAYTSISHFGFIVLGIFVLTSQGQAGATLYMVNHGFATGALFLVAGFMIARRRSQRIADYGGVQKVAPVLAGLFLISGLAGLSLPGLSTFVSEFLVLVGTFTRYRAAAAAATASIVLAAIYILWMYQRTMTGPVRPETEHMADLRPRELWAVGPLVALLIVFGVYPQPLLNIINPAVRHTLVQVHVTDPVPPHPATAISAGAGRLRVRPGTASEVSAGAGRWAVTPGMAGTVSAGAGRWAVTPGTVSAGAGHLMVTPTAIAGLCRSPGRSGPGSCTALQPGQKGTTP